MRLIAVSLMNLVALAGLASPAHAALAPADAPGDARVQPRRADASAAPAQPAALTLYVSATCPEGGPARVGWTGATPSKPVILIYSAEFGSFRVPDGSPCEGTILGLGVKLLRVIFHGNSSPGGSRILQAHTGPGACGNYLQLLDLTTCELSSVVLIE